MTKKTIKVRAVRFGLRYKISLIIAAAAVLVAGMMSMAVISQYQTKIKNEMLRMSSTIMQGGMQSAAVYLRLTKILNSTREPSLPPHQVPVLIKDRENSLVKTAEYFSSIIREQNLLDIAYLITFDWPDIDADWNSTAAAQYIYFSRTQAAVQLKGWNDPKLKPSIFAHYMKTIDTGAYLTMAVGYARDQKQFVIVGMPIFRQDGDASVYARYLNFKKKTYHSKADIIAGNAEKKYHEQYFIRRLVEQGTKFNYNIAIDSRQKSAIITNFILSNFTVSRISPQQRMSLLKNISEEIVDSATKDGKIPLSLIKAIINREISSGMIQKKNRAQELGFWKNFYYFLTYNKFRVSSPVALEELARTSYRKDLAGIIGLFLKRSDFHTEMRANVMEIMNLSLSILIRCVLIALFFPTFLIRSLSRLGEGAYAIGRGELDTKISIAGSDEIGQLADIFNLMTLNLKTAQDSLLEKRRMEDELKTAQQIQEALLPSRFPVIPNVEFGSYYAAQTESGGDYYDFIPLADNAVGIVIADVSGHGVGSALVMAMTRTLLHLYAGKSNNPKRILEEINEYLYENTASNFFVSLFFGIIDLPSLKLSYAGAGHHPAIILRNRSFLELDAGGIALGAVSNKTFSRFVENNSLVLERGDYIVEYTDGVVEAVNAGGDEFGKTRLHEALLAEYGAEPQVMVDKVVSAVKNFTGTTPQRDDITLSIVRIN
jgi:serine phosphatase RsbU (regulator of sigma subunit)